MKVSDITRKEIAEYLRLEFDDLDVSELVLIDNLIRVAKAYIKSYTGLSERKIDEHEDFVIVVYVLCQDMYDNRTLYNNVSSGSLSPNRVVETILGMHSVNLL